MSRRGTLLVLVGALAIGGCGLTLDVDPPDQRPDGGSGMDGAHADGGRLDAGDAAPADGNRADANRPDTGTRECDTRSDCNDGNACNGTELCIEGRCKPGEPVTCLDDDPCDGVLRCVEGECVEGPAPSCDDGNPCNGFESCVEGVGCRTVEPALDCDDGFECTVDSCDPDTGCAHEPDDSVCTEAAEGFCNVELGCQYSSCTDATCTAGPCQDAVCESDACIRTSICASSETCCGGSCVPAGCSDDNPCTDDFCDPSEGCVHTFNTAPCDDGSACTTTDRCSMGRCVGIGSAGCSDGNPCTIDECVDGGCERDPAPRGTVCGVNAACDGSGHCTCATGFTDCDGDGDCDCLSSDGCEGALCASTSCEITRCPDGQTCCVETGECYFETCLGCCMPAA